MPVTTGTVNPTSTVTNKNIVGRNDGGYSNDLKFSVAASGTCSWTIDADAYPCTFLVVSNNTAAPTFGTILAYNSSTIDVVAGSTGLDDGAPGAATDFGAAISSGTITLTAGASITNPSIVRVVRTA